MMQLNRSVLGSVLGTQPAVKQTPDSGRAREHRSALHTAQLGAAQHRFPVPSKSISLTPGEVEPRICPLSLIQADRVLSFSALSCRLLHRCTIDHSILLMRGYSYWNNSYSIIRSIYGGI